MKRGRGYRVVHIVWFGILGSRGDDTIFICVFCEENVLEAGSVGAACNIGRAYVGEGRFTAAD